MDVTLLVCTWNRAERLDETLTSLARRNVPSGVRWEVVVVDNNSTDDTAAGIARRPVVRSRAATRPGRPLRARRGSRGPSIIPCVRGAAGLDRSTRQLYRQQVTAACRLVLE